MVPSRLWLLSISLLFVSAGIPATDVNADVTVPIPGQAEEVLNGIYLVDIQGPDEASKHAPDSPESISWSHEPGDRSFGQAYQFKVLVVAVDDGEVKEEKKVSCGFAGFSQRQTCGTSIRMPVEPGLYDIHVRMVTGPNIGVAVNPLIGGEELCDETRGFFQPCDVVRVRVIEPAVNIQVYQVCTQDTSTDLNCVGHPMFGAKDLTIDVPADKELMLTGHPGGITRPFTDVAGNISITGDLRCVSGQVTCTDLGGGQAEAVHEWWTHGPDSEGFYTGMAPLVVANGPAAGTCSDVIVLIDAHGGGFQDTMTGTLTLCGV